MEIKSARRAQIARKTNETNIDVAINLDEYSPSKITTGVGFLDHMLEQIARHSQITLNIEAQGDYHIDDHHCVEDVGICVGQALAQSLSDKKGVNRYGQSYVPLDEALSRVVLDLSGRPSLHFFVEFPSQKIGQFDTELIREFFQALVNHAGITLHIDSLRGINSHHIAESIFKAFARALRDAIAIDDKNKNSVPSTKGKL